MIHYGSPYFSLFITYFQVLTRFDAGQGFTNGCDFRGPLSLSYVQAGEYLHLQWRPHGKMLSAFQNHVPLQADTHDDANSVSADGLCCVA